MSKEDYVAQEIEEKLYNYIKNKYFKHFEIGAPDYIWNKRALCLFKLKLRLIKFHKTNCSLMSFKNLINDFELIKKENILSIKENYNFEKFIKEIKELENKNNNQVVKVIQNYQYITMQLTSWFDLEKNYIYESIIQFEEEQRIKKIIKNF